MIQRAREIAESEPSHFANQLENVDAAKGCEQIGQELGPDHTVVTVAVDSGLKYLAGDLFKQEDL